MAHKEENLTPPAPQQAKKPETPETRVEQELKKEKTKLVEFKKDVRFLWIYASIFCVVLLALVGGSAVIQRKIHRQVEGYREQTAAAQDATTSAKSRLNNIQDENTQLKNSNEALSFENETLKDAAKIDGRLIKSAKDTITELEKLSRVGRLYLTKKAEASSLFETIDPDLLPENAKETYQYYEEKLK